MRYDVIVIGGGHAGTEAAAASARFGAKTALVTQRLDTLGTMSCNPAIGGLGKGHLVREIDALDGLMGLAADQGGIQFRVLNRRKGPAVRGPRTQADRRHYALAIQTLLQSTPNLCLVEGEVTDLALADDKRTVRGVVLHDGRHLEAGAVVLTTGTFLNGLIHRGEHTFAAGRVGEAPSVALAERLRSLGLPMGRLKTGTPPRLDGRTIDWSQLDRQEADEVPEPFSLLTTTLPLPQVACGITRTTAQTHAIIQNNLQRSAMYSGRIQSRGPRYCPSIEDKIVRFDDRDSHQIFLEPEGLDVHTIYPNGLSTSLPEDVQHDFLRSMPGLERVNIEQYGYAIEYDYVDPRSLDRTLALPCLHGLFLAGQINGTTGYEEAAAQGLLAGLNAARLAGGSEMVTIDRAQGYIGVMVDDLVTLGVSEPYRMFTSRAEYRLTLRADNAHQRLTRWGVAGGVVGTKRMQVWNDMQVQLDHGLEQLRSLHLTPHEARQHGLALNQDGQRRSAFQLLSHPTITWSDLQRIWPALASISDPIQAQLDIEAKYAVYVDRQDKAIQDYREDENYRLSDDLDYFSLSGLSRELQDKLTAIRPASLSQAARIEGMTPAALTLLTAYAQRKAVV